MSTGRGDMSSVARAPTRPHVEAARSLGHPPERPDDLEPLSSSRAVPGSAVLANTSLEPRATGALLPDEAAAHLGLRVWRSASGRAALLYGEIPGYRVTAGIPCAPASERGALHGEFVADCRRAGLKPLHFGLTDAALEFLPSDIASSAPRRTARWHLGDLPVFDLARWRAEATMPAGIRAQMRRARRLGVTVHHWPAPPSPAERAALCAVRDAWLRAKPLPALAFLTTPYVFEPWPADGVFVAEARGRFVGFLIGCRVVFGDMLRVDVVARCPGAPNGTAELLVGEAFRRAARQGVERATLGLAPLSRRTNVRMRGWRGVAAGCARRFGAPLYSFAGLEAFKAKFAPDVWVPLYAVAPGRAFGLRDLCALGRAFVGGSLRRYLLRIASRALLPRNNQSRVTPSAVRP